MKSNFGGDTVIEFSVQVEGAEDAIRELSLVVERTFTVMDAYTKATLPKAINDETPIRTGELRKGNQVQTRHTGYMLQVEFRNNVLYAQFVINGTSKMRANNYPERASRRYQAKLDYYTKDWLTRL